MTYSPTEIGLRLFASRSNLILLHVNNKGAGQSLYRCSLISAFAICSIECIIPNYLVLCEVSIFLLVTVNCQARFSLTSKTPKTGVAKHI